MEYLYNFIPNPKISLEQPEKFGDVEDWWELDSFIGATLFEKNGKTMVRSITLESELGEDTVKSVEASYREDGWYIEHAEIIKDYYRKDKYKKLLAPNYEYIG